MRDDYILTKLLEVIKGFRDSFYKTLQRNDTFGGNLFPFSDGLFQLLLSCHWAKWGVATRKAIVQYRRDWNCNFVVFLFAPMVMLLRLISPFKLQLNITYNSLNKARTRFVRAYFSYSTDEIKIYAAPFISETVSEYKSCLPSKVCVFSVYSLFSSWQCNVTSRVSSCITWALSW